MGISAGEIVTKIKFNADISSVTQAVNQLQSNLSKLTLPNNIGSNLAIKLSDLNKLLAKYEQQSGTVFKSSRDLQNFEKTSEQIKTIYKSIVTDLERIDTSKLKINFEGTNIKEYRNLVSELVQARKDLQETFSQQFTSSKNEINNILGVAANPKEKIKGSGLKGISNAKQLFEEFSSALDTEDIQQIDQAITKLENHLIYFQDSMGNLSANGLKWKQGVEDIRKSFNKVAQEGGIKEARDNVEQLQAKVSNFHTNNIKEGTENFIEMTQAAKAGEQVLDKLSDNLLKTKNSQVQLNNATSAFGNKVAYFFSATNAVRMLRRALTEAYNTVKELDKVMTETAVVTNFSVSDMWDQLPTYAAEAGKLGVSIKSAYESATLYYQQGLKTNEVMQLSNETLKMARIARLDAAEATDRMTNALRGFNMTLDETSATRVSDVYSKIAAITASNVDEISTAMTKTASLASSANMSFENTAAFLAQIIETTRESADTAGTALKTVIARFAELKNNPADIVSVEGEEVSYNKVDAALQSVGISLNNFMNGTEGLDSVFMRLSAKWDSLDVATQRYIATMAAGSRQQSRFIALMQDYGRMQELTAAATNANGASAEQYNKTLDSMESKLAKLKNQWDQFTMSLANNQVLKGFVDILTRILELLNNLTDKFGNLGSTIVKVVGLIGAIKVGRNVGTEIGNLIIPEITGTARATGETWWEHFVGGIHGRASKGDEKLNAAVNQVFDAGKAKYTLDRTFMSKAQNTKTEIERENAGIANQADWSRLEEYKAIQQQMDDFMAKGPEYQQAVEEISKAQDSFNTALANNQGHRAYKQAVEDLTIINKKYGIGQNELAELQKRHDQQLAQSAMAYAKVAFAASALISTVANLKGMSSEMQNTLNKLSSATAKFATILIGLPPVLKAIGVTAELSFPILLAIAAAIVAVIESIKIINEIVYNNSIEGKLEKTKESLSAVNQELDETKNKLDEIESSVSDLDELRTQFDTLIVGSREFNDALNENNQQVLSLISKFPELAKAVTTGVYGELKFDDAIYEDILDQLTEREVKLTNVAMGLQTYNSKLENEKAMQDLTTVNAFARIMNAATFGFAWGDKMQSSAIVDDIQTLYEEGQLTGEAMQDLADKYGVEIDMVAELANTVSGIKANQEAQKKETQGLIQSTLLSTVDQKYSQSDLGQIIIEGISKSQAESYDARIETLVNKYNDIYSSTDDLAAAYAQRMGYNNVEDVPESVRSNRASMLQGLAVDEIQSEMLNLFTGFFDKYSGKITNGSSAEQFFNLASGNIANVSEEVINGALNTEDIVKLLQDTIKETGTSLDELLKLYGVDTTEQLLWSLTQAQNSIVNASNQMKNEIASALTDATKGNLDQAKAYANSINKLTYSQQASVKTILENIKDSGVNVAQAFLDGLQEGLSEADFNDYTKFINQLPLNDAINAYSQLDRAASNEASNAAIKKFATNTITNQSFGKGQQLQQYLKSADFNNQVKSINKKIAKGKFDATTISELMSSSELLTTMISENSAITKENLAQVIKLVQSGAVEVNGLTNRVVEAIGAFNNLESVTNETAAAISEMDFGQSSYGVIKQLNEKIKDFKELIDNKAYGDIQVQKYLSAFYSQDYASTLDTVEEIQAATDKIVRYGQGDGINFWDDYATGAIKAVEALNLVKDAYGSYTVTLRDNITTEALAKQIADEHNLSLETANSLVLSLISLNPELAKTLREADYSQGIDNFILNSQNIGDYVVMAQSEIDALAAYTNKTADEIAADIQDKLGSSFEVITLRAEDIFNESATPAANFARQFNDDIDSILKNLNVLYDNGNIDYTSFFDWLITEGGQTAEAANDIINSIAEETGRALQETLSLLKWNPDTKAFEPAEETITAQTSNALENAANAWQEKQSFETLGVTLESTVYNAFVRAIDQVAKDYPDLFGDKKPQVSTKATGIKAPYAGNQTSNNSGTKNSNTSLPTLNVPGQKTVTMPTLTVPGQTSISSSDITKIFDVNSKTNTAIAGLVNSTKISNPNSQTRVLASNKNTSQTDISTTKTQNNKEDELDTIKKAIEKKNGSGAGGSVTAQVNYGEQAIADGLGDVTDKLKEIKNDFDKLYNILGIIKTLQEQISYYTKGYANLTKYGASIKNGNYGVSDLIENRLNRLQKYNQEINALQSEKKQSASAAKALVSEFGAYVGYDSRTNNVKINYEAIDKLAKTFDTSTKSGEKAYDNAKDYYDKVKDAVSKIEGYASNVKNANDELYQIQAAVEEIKNEGLDEYLQLETRVANALESIETKAVDKLEAVATAINNSNSKIVTAMQEQISESRKARQQEKDLSDLEEKRRKLAYLKQDTSGGNRQAILSLQKEINEAEQNYTDSLIDNAVEKLQKQNEVYERQSSEQISLLREIIAWNKESGAYNAAAMYAIWSSIGEDGKFLAEDSAVYEILYRGEGWGSYTYTALESEKSTLNQNIVSAGEYLATHWDELKYLDSYVTGTDLSNLENLIGKKLIGEGSSTPLSKYVENNGGILVSIGEIEEEITDKCDDIISYLEAINTSISNISFSSDTSGGSGGGSGGGTGGGSGGGTGGGTGSKSMSSIRIKGLQQFLIDYWGVKDLLASGTYDSATKNAVKALQSAVGVSADGLYGSKTQEALQKLLNRIQPGKSAPTAVYKTGGLADFTGPAWLDGSASRPELVLNATDTQTFIKFVDYLRDWGGKTESNTTQNSGSSYYDIDINIDEISGENDVDLMVNKIKNEIVTAAKRNNRTVTGVG